jgi:acyl-CoA hydrolase
MELISTHAILGSDMGFNGTLFGGRLLAWLDSDAVSYAMQLCDTNKMVTVSIDKCVFQKPAKPGQLIKIYAEVKEFGNTSITLHVEARRHNVYTGLHTLILSTNMKFVRVDDEGSPIPISDRVKKRYIEKKKLNQSLTE